MRAGALLLALLLVAAPAAARTWSASPPTEETLPWARVHRVVVPVYHGAGCALDSTHLVADVSGLAFGVALWPIPGTGWTVAQVFHVAEYNARGEGLVAPGDTLAFWVAPPTPGTWWLTAHVVGSWCWTASKPVLYLDPGGWPPDPATLSYTAPVLETGALGWR